MTTSVVCCNPAEIITKFLAISQAGSSANGAEWSVVRRPGQPTDEESKAPIEALDSGFYDWTAEQLDKYHEERLPKSTGLLTHRVFVMLDARSGQDKTVVLHTLVVTYPQDNLDTADPDPEAEIGCWRSFRVKFEDTGIALAQLEQTQHLYLDRIDEAEAYVEHGMFEVPG